MQTIAGGKNEVGWRVADVMAWIEQLAPLSLAEEWDNVGLQLGQPNEPVSRIMTALGVSPAVVEQAAQFGAELIVAHHPLIFRPLRAVRTDQYPGNVIASLLRRRIAVYVAHTNLDACPNGAGAWLAQAVGLVGGQPLVPVGEASSRQAQPAGFGWVGDLASAMMPGDFLAHLTAALATPIVRWAGPMPERVSKVAVINGAGAEYMDRAAAAGADALVTGDVKHHDAERAAQLGLWVIDAGHYATEACIPHRLAEYLAAKLAAAEGAGEVAVARECDPFGGASSPAGG